MLIIETHKFYNNDHNVEIQNKEIWIDNKLSYSCKNGDEVEYTDGKNSDSPFYGKTCIQTLYITSNGTIQQNQEDDSFYFRLADGVTMASYVDGELMPEDPEGLFNEHVTFANTLMAK
ncbi:TPA: hypothetical protein ACXDFY_003853 [Enterobacter roggenkampii]